MSDKPLSADCPSREQLYGYAIGDLPEDTASDVSAHVEQCPPCEETLVDLEQQSDTLVSALGHRVEKDSFLDEAGLGHALAMIKQIGREPSVAGDGGGSQTTTDVELGSLREYKLLAKIGEGGMGTVYKAMHTELEKVVALKVLPSERMQDERAVARFKREIKAVGKLDHPNIVRATDAGHVDDTHFLVMEYVDGVDLSDLVRRVGPLRVADACGLVRQAAIGLQHAHEHDLVHRDIKPSNVMLTRGGQVKVLDLGLALLAEHHGTGETELTNSGQMMGTLDYMAPEQGSDSHVVDIRADIYSLGATLYKLLTGQAPFADPKLDTPLKKMAALMTADVPDVRDARPNLSEPVAALVHQMLDRDPDKRPATPAEVATALAPWTAGHDLTACASVAESGAAVSAEDCGTQTFDHLSSAYTDTAPSPSRSQPQSSPTSEPQPDPAPAAKGDRGRFGRRTAVAAALAGVVLMATVFYLQTPDGTVRIEVNDENLVVLLDDDRITFEDKTWKGRRKARKHKLAIKLGEQELKIGPDAVVEIADGNIEHRLTIQLNGIDLSSNEFTVVRNGDNVLKISYEEFRIDTVEQADYEAVELKNTIAPADGWVDLLASVDVPRDTTGSWRKDAGEFVGYGGLMLPVRPSGRFEWEVEFTHAATADGAIDFLIPQAAEFDVGSGLTAAPIAGDRRFAADLLDHRERVTQSGFVQERVFFDTVAQRRDQRVGLLFEVDQRLFAWRALFDVCRYVRGRVLREIPDRVAIQLLARRAVCREWFVGHRRCLREVSKSLSIGTTQARYAKGHFFSAI